MLKTANRRKVLLILGWFQKKFGKSKFWDGYPVLKVYQTKGKSVDNDEKGVYGLFLDGVISIFVGRHNTYLELCKTVAHEYKHYLLSEDDFYKKYRALKKKGYAELEALRTYHPHEKMTKRFENKWGGICYNELKNEFRKRK